VLCEQLPEGSCGFDSSLYRAALDPAYPCQLLLYANVLGSTQTLLEGHPQLCGAAGGGASGNGLVCTAAVQTAGRGRRTNQWESPSGCLMFSFAWRHEQAETVVFMQYLFGLSLVDSVRQRAGYEDVDLRLKWPNDIYLGTQTKVGGILVSSSYESGGFNLIIGCGLNVSNAHPTTSLDCSALPRPPRRASAVTGVPADTAA
jgi:biotin--protein ligase